jgi:spore germination protein KC
MSSKERWQKMKKLVSYTLIILLIISLTGCIPTKELKNLSIVESVGFDSTGTNSFKLTFQIFNPKSASGGGSDKKSSGGSTELVAQSTGAGIYDAIRNATLAIGRKLYFSNTYIYFVGEDLCRNNFDSLIDFLERPSEIRPNEAICVVKSTAEDLLTAKKDDQIIPAQKINEIVESYGTSSKILDTELEDVYENESTGITDIALPAVKVTKDDKGDDIITMDGTAVFKKNILAGYLDADETRGALWIMGKVNSGIIVTKPSQGGTVSMEITSEKTGVKVITKDSKPAIKIDVNFNSDIVEMQTSGDAILDKDYLTELKSLQEDVVKKEISSAITKAIREYDSDIFGFGFMIFENQPDYWKKNKLNWENELKSIPIEITVNSKIRHSGTMTDKTTLK